MTNIAMENHHAINIYFYGPSIPWLCKSSPDGRCLFTPGSPVTPVPGGSCLPRLPAFASAPVADFGKARAMG